MLRRLGATQGEDSMDQVHSKRIRRGVVATLAGALAVPVMWAVAPLTAHAAVPCTVSLGVTQSDTTVTGTPLPDIIDCSAASPGKTINGLSGDDTITGTAF